MNRKKIKQIIALNLTLATVTLSSNSTTYAFTNEPSSNYSYQTEQYGNINKNVYMNELQDNIPITEFTLQATTNKMNYDTNTTSKMNLENDGHYYYDGTTLSKEENIFTLDITSNKELKNINISLNNVNIITEDVSSTLYTKEITLTKGTDNLITVFGTDIDGHTYTSKYTITVDSARHNIYTKVLDSNGNLFSFEDKDNTSYYGSKDSFNISTTLEGLNSTNLDKNSFKAICNNKSLSFDLNYQLDAFIVKDIPSGNQTINLTYVDKFNHYYTKTINTNINNEVPKMTTDIDNTYKYSVNNISASLKLDIQDSTLNSESLNLEQVSTIPEIVKETTLYFYIKNKAGNTVYLDKDKINVEKIDNILYVDYSEAIKVSSNLIEDDYTLDYIYYNDVKTPTNTSNSFESYNFNIDNTLPEVIKASNINLSDSKNIIEENSHNFTVFKDQLTLFASSGNSSFSLQNNYLSFTSNSSDVADYNISVKKLVFLDDSLNTSESIKINSFQETSYTIDEEGYYEISYTYTDFSKNITQGKLYVAIDKNQPTTNFYLINKSGEKADIHGSLNSTKEEVIPYIEINDVSYDFEKSVADDFKIQTYYLEDDQIKNKFYSKGDLMEASALPNENPKYGTKYYYLGSSSNNSITKTLLKDCKFSIYSSVQDFYNEPVISENLFSVETTIPSIKFNLNDNDLNIGTILFTNKAPSFYIEVSNTISDGSVSYSIINSNGTDITNNFTLVTSEDNSNFNTNYTLKYNSSSDNLDELNGFYTLDLTYNSSSGNTVNEKRTFVLDTNSPSYRLTFSDKNLPDDATEVQSDANSKILLLASNKSKLTFLPGENKIYCGYDNLYLNFTLLDNSFDMAELNKETELSKFSLKLNNQDILTDAPNRTVSLDANTFAEDKIYNLSLSSKDNSENTMLSNLDIVINRTAPIVTLGVKDDNKFELKGINKNNVFYFKNKITPFLKVSSPILSSNEMRYNLTINDIQFFTNLSETEYSNKLTSLGDGNYNIKTSVTDFAGNTNTNVLGDFNYSNETGVNYVVDTITPEDDICLFSDTSLTSVTDYNSTESKFYVVVKDEPNLDKDNFIKSLKLSGSNAIGMNSPKDLTTIENITVNNVTESMKDKLSEFTTNTTIFEISNNNETFKNGYYQISYDLTDYSGNKTSTNKLITIDNTTLNVTNTFDDKKYYNSSVNFDISIGSCYSGFNTSLIKLTKNGQDVTSDFVTNTFNDSSTGGNITVSIPLNDYNKDNEGTYTFETTIKNNLGQDVNYSFNFVMDRTKIDLTNFDLAPGHFRIKDKTYYTNSDNPGVNFNLSSDLSGEAKRIVQVNNEEVTTANNQIPDSIFAKEGSYLIKFTFYDNAGNVSSFEHTVIVDKTAPTLSIDGFNGVIDSEDNLLYINRNISPIVSVSDEFGEDISERKTFLDFSQYTSVISDNGHHIYKVDAVDLAGNSTSKEIEFILDTVAPDINLNNVTNYKFYNIEVAPTFSTPDSTAKLSAYLNGSLYTANSITGDGEYDFKLICTDKARNITEQNVHFVIDTKNPVISVFGINENQINGVLTPNIQVDESNAEILAYINGEYYYGGAITDSGKYVLVVKAIDRSGNISEKIVSFIIDSNLPQIIVSNIENSQVYAPGLQPSISATKDSKITMLLNKMEYDGSSITDIGDYELEITAVDAYGNKGTATYNFKIENISDSQSVSANLDTDSSTDVNLEESSSTSLWKTILPIATGAVALIGSTLGYVFFKKR